MKVTVNILQLGNNTGIEVPADVPAQLGGGTNPLVTVTLNGFTYPSKIATMGGKLLISVSAEVRAKAGVKGGETHEIELLLDDKPRIIEPPADLAAALAANPAAQAAWNKLAPTIARRMSPPSRGRRPRTPGPAASTRLSRP